MVSTTITVLVTVTASLPEASEALYVKVYVPTVSVSTEPETDGVIEPEASETATPASTYDDPSSTFTVALPVNVITGFVVSTTFTVLVADAILPEESVAKYVTVYDPTSFVLTDATPTDLTVTDAESSSADAPASVYAVPNSTVAGLLPAIVMTGLVVSGLSELNELPIAPTTAIPSMNAI